MRVTHETLAAYCGIPTSARCSSSRSAASRSWRSTSPTPRGGTASRPRSWRSSPRAARCGRPRRAAASRRRSPARSPTQEREWCDVSELVLSLKCGGSDYTSGLASNPTLGRVTDRLVELGGTAVLGEIAEIMGAEHLLASRATHAGDGDAADSDHHARRDRGARARPRHPRHAAVARATSAAG